MPAQLRAVDVYLRELAARVLERARRPMRVDVAFAVVSPDGRVVEVEAAPPSGDQPAAPLTAHDFASLELDPSLAREDALRAAVQQRIDPRDREQSLRSFVGAPARAGPLEIIPLIRFDARVFAAQPILSAATLDDESPRCRSLLEGIAWTLLDEGRRAVGGHAPKTRREPSLDRLSPDPEDVLRTAGRWMMVTAGHMTGHPQGLIGLFDEINEISSLRYEGRDPSGGIVIARLDHPATHNVLAFDQAVPLGEATWARRMLELSSGRLQLITDSIHIHALGTVSSEYEAQREDLFSVVFSGHQRWELEHARTTFMRVAYGIPTLPEDPLDAAAVRSALRAEFGALSDGAIERIWGVLRSALGQRYGALVVIAEDAESEAMRLANQGTRVHPAELDDETVERVTTIDGAVLLDTMGLCHAIGVILDGRARRDVGSPARGARYNSAARYVDAAERPALAVVLSEDGTVDVVRRGASRRAKAHAA